MIGQVLIAHPHPEALAAQLVETGHVVTTVSSRKGLLRALAGQPVHLALLSTLLDEGEGLAALEEIHILKPDLPVLVATAPGGDNDAAVALRRGAADCIRLPCTPAELLARVERLLAAAMVSGESLTTHDILGPDGRPRPVFHRSRAMAQAIDTLLRVAPSRSTVLILGESGVGKELFARSIHFNSPRRDGPWVPLNCTAIPETMIESEMFGHERGAFTGAVNRVPGKFELAHGGTIFLDEIGDMSPSAQMKLLRVLEDRQVMRVGGIRPVHVDIRLIAATNCDLEERRRRGEFREDLFYRLNVVTLRVPSLRARSDDIPELIDHFLADVLAANHLPPRRLEPEARAMLQNYRWPGNVRELKNLLESLALTVPGPDITAQDLPLHIQAAPSQGMSIEGLRAGICLMDAEKELIRVTMEHVRGNRARAAGLLRISVRTLQRKLHRYGLTTTGRRAAG